MNAATKPQGGALNENLWDSLPKVGGEYERLPTGRIVPRTSPDGEPTTLKPTAVPAADPETTKED